MIHKLISVLRTQLLEIVNRIDNEDCNLDDDEVEEIVTTLQKFTAKDVRMSKYQACEYLHISRATFDNYVSYGWIPKGQHQQGFKELSWTKKDLDKFKKNNLKKTK